MTSAHHQPSTATNAAPDPAARPTPVLCVDDNEQICDALRVWLTKADEFAWAGELRCADNLCAAVRDARPNPGLVLLDIDMPGMSPFDAIRDLAAQSPDTRVIIFSGYVRTDLVDRAIEAGAWGYVSKNDGETALFDAMRRVSHGELVLSPQAELALRRGQS